MRAMSTKATRSSQSRLRGKKSRLSRSRFQAIFPGFISKSSGVENSILKEKWRGGGESWMKKEGGLRGYNPTTSKKRQSFSLSYVFHIYHFHECRFSPKSVSVMMKMPRIRPAMGKLLINIWFECVPFHRLSSPFFRLVFATLLATEKDCDRRATLVPIIPRRQAKKSPVSKSFFLRMQIVATPSVGAELRASSRC